MKQIITTAITSMVVGLLWVTATQAGPLTYLQQLLVMGTDVVTQGGGFGPWGTPHYGGGKSDTLAEHDLGKGFWWRGMKHGVETESAGGRGYRNGYGDGHGD